MAKTIRIKLQSLDKALAEIIAKQSRITDVTLKDAWEVSRGAASSPSSSGDREHAVNQALLNKDNLENLKRLKATIEQELTQEIPARIVPICYVTLDGGLEFYLVDKVVYLRDFKFVSTNSPLGNAILGKTAGQNYAYQVEDQQVTGKIISIE